MNQSDLLKEKNKYVQIRVDKEAVNAERYLDARLALFSLVSAEEVRDRILRHLEQGMKGSNG